MELASAITKVLEGSQSNEKSLYQRMNKVAMTVRVQLGSPLDQAFPSTDSSIPVYLAHCSDDHIVDIELGRQSKDVLTSLGHELTWRAPNEGHWINEHVGIDGFNTILLLQMT